MKLPHVSASQVKTFQRCKRKWYFEKVEGKRGPSTQAQRRGTAIHDGLEQYVKTGNIPEFVYVNEKTGRVTNNKNDEEWAVRRYVEAVKEHIDDETVIGVETDMKLETFPGGPPWIGFIDLLASNKVIDYKTTSSLRWAKTPDDLLNDPQACSYVLSVFRQFPEADEFDVKFIYVQTSTKTKVNVKPVIATFNRKQCEDIFGTAVVSVREMVDVALIKTADDVEGNPGACMDFGGCPHRAYCKMEIKSTLSEKPTHKPKPNRFTHPELFKKKKKKENPSFRPPEVKDETHS